METAINELREQLKEIKAMLASPVPPKELLSVEEAGEFIGVSKVTLDEWRCRGGGPAYHRIGRRILYSVTDLRNFAAASRVEALR
ncbi:helix-turn-helix domain-containing protein [Sinorhizobium meliloti]|uniref:helix-turn-helix transcriptional regulator n=1 Tax=Rhizobium meliloti TaxID=382 RepID=UPI001294A758|nr:helix-turn-helix domain-containing protein [Sinorhizobium meliloti]MQW64885.1 helix-turn-helix domain-containing protein [Sinorhizobium meliloti]